MTEQFFEHDFSEAEVGRVIRARVYSELNQNFSGQRFDALLADKLDRSGADVRAGYERLCESGMTHGFLGRLVARMRVGVDALAAPPFAATKPLIGMGGGAVAAALSRGATRFGQTLTSLSDDLARVLSRCRTGCSGLSDDLAASRYRLIEYSVDDSLVFTGDMGATYAFGNVGASRTLTDRASRDDPTRKRPLVFWHPQWSFPAITSELPGLVV